jgi:hypothetical protein
VLTDQQALQLLEDMRRNTRSMGVIELCDWIRALVRRLEAAAPAAADAAPKAAKANRNAYMKEYMRRRRAEKSRIA